MTREVAPRGAPAGGPSASTTGANCGVEYLAIVQYHDDVTASVGLPPTTDTLRVCQTWVGNDFVTHETQLGRAHPAWYGGDPLRVVTYGGGVINGYGADGGSVGAPAVLSGTMLDALQVDAATRAALADDPYFYLYAPDPGCADPTAIVCSRVTRADSLGGGPSATRDVAQGAPNRRHGLTRRGVRALVEQAAEVDAGADAGTRKFRRTRGREQVEFLVDRRTGLLVGEEVRGPDGRRSTRNRWRQVGNAFVREMSTTEIVEGAPGREQRTRMVTEIREFRRNPAADRRPEAGR